MKTEKELLDILKNENVNAYKLNAEIEINNLIEVDNLEVLIRFAHDNNINSVFYFFPCVDEYILTIGEEDLDELNIDEEILSTIKDEIDIYNDKVSKLDFSKPLTLDVYCIHQGMMLFTQENDSWLFDEGIDEPKMALKTIVENHLEEIESQRKEKKDKIKNDILKGREVLLQKILNDEEFHKCTNGSLRKIYANKIFKGNNENAKLFWSRGGFYDMSMNSFIDYAWNEYKNSIKKIYI